MHKVVAEFCISYRQILDENGTLVDTVPTFATDPQQLIAMYKNMVLTRSFDARAIALQRTGKLGTYPSTLGQEAIGCGIGFAMHQADILCPYYRENAAYFARGVKLEEILLYWGGSELGSNYADPKVKQDFPICVPISSQNLHAVGAALALKMRKQKNAVVAVVGDGGTSRGDFYEAINFAGVQQLPVVFVINNNQYAISVPLNLQTATQTLAQKGIAAGVHSEQVDGNDVLVVRQTVAAALERAYEGKGPSVIEAITYRLCDHTTADDAKRYREIKEVEAAQSKEPLTRLRKYLQAVHQWSDDAEKTLQDEVTRTISGAVDRYLATPKQPATAMFDYLYATLPAALRGQRDQVT